VQDQVHGDRELCGYSMERGKEAVCHPRRQENPQVEESKKDQPVSEGTLQ
jgi:hypothetical protein